MNTLWDQFEFEVNVEGIYDSLRRFAKYLEEPEEDNFNYPYIYQAIVCNIKATEADAEVTATSGTRRPTNRAERRKATAHAKNHRKNLAKYSDDEIRTNSGKVIDSGIRSYERGKKLYTRKGRVARNKFTGEPFDPWDDGDYLSPIDHETGLELPVGSGYWSDETLSEAINNYKDSFYGLCDCDDYDDEPEKIEEEPDIPAHLVEDLHQYNRQLELEVCKLYDFIGEYNLDKLFSQWEKQQENN